MIDKTTKLLLLALALGLWANVMISLFRPPTTSAQASYNCTGDLKANTYGGDTATKGGYVVDVKCR